MAQEMKKDKAKAAGVDRLLTGTDTPFTQQVTEYHLPKKFKVPQIQSYTGIGYHVEHLENF
jgi:hypothetical protein